MDSFVARHMMSRVSCEVKSGTGYDQGCRFSLLLCSVVDSSATDAQNPSPFASVNVAADQPGATTLVILDLLLNRRFAEMNQPGFPGGQDL